MNYKMLIKEMLDDYSFYVAKLGYNKADKEMKLKYGHQWDFLRETIWQQHDFEVANQPKQN